MEMEADAATSVHSYRVSTTWMSTMQLITESIRIDSDDYALEQLYAPCHWFVQLFIDEAISLI